MGMVARNEVRDQLGLIVKKEEFITKLAAREQAESSWRSPTHCSSGYPSCSPSPESRAILEEENRSRREEDRRRQTKESPRLVAQIRAERADELARASKATNF